MARDALGEWPKGSMAGLESDEEEGSYTSDGRLLTNIMMMGMGEPLYNFDNVRDALKLVMDGDGLALSKRRITLSTAGVVPMMARAGEEIGVNLAVSLHAVTKAPYYLGVFLVGAYQEILGDLHNLFGDTHAVHVTMDQNGAARLDALVKGDTVKEVLDYVEFDAETLLRKLRTDVETAVRDGRVDYEGAGRLLRFYEDGLHGYTYLEDPSER